MPYETSITRSEDGLTEHVTTFVVVARPNTEISLGCVEADLPFAGFSALPLCRLQHPIYVPNVPSFAFPLPASSGPYLCTQGVGGHLTHFFPESYYAIDLRCPCNTPILSLGDGVVESIIEKHSCSGIHCGNLEVWNSVRLHYVPCIGKKRSQQKFKTPFVDVHACSPPHQNQRKALSIHG